MRNHRPLLGMVIVRVMTRIPYVRREELGPRASSVGSIVNGRGDLVVTADGGLAGPFNAFVTAPGAGRRMSSLGATLRFGTSIERRLSEIAIITIGARWQAEFEWWAHAPMAREHGVAEAVVDAIGRGEDPPFEADDERAVYTWPASSVTLAAWTRRPTMPRTAFSAMPDGGAGVAVRVLHAGLVPAERVHGAAAAGCRADVGRIVTLPAEATGSAPGRGGLTGRRVLVVGAGTRPSPEPDPPFGNGRAISVLAAREGAAVACADRDAGAAEATAALVVTKGGSPRSCWPTWRHRTHARRWSRSRRQRWRY